jgi:hypothetical protein
MTQAPFSLLTVVVSPDAALMSSSSILAASRPGNSLSFFSVVLVGSAPVK